MKDPFLKTMQEHRPTPPESSVAQKEGQKEAIWQAIVREDEKASRPWMRSWLQIAVPAFAVVLIAVVSLVSLNRQNAERNAAIGETVASAMEVSFIEEETSVDAVEDLILLADGDL